MLQNDVEMGQFEGFKLFLKFINNQLQVEEWIFPKRFETERLTKNYSRVRPVSIVNYTKTGSRIKQHSNVKDLISYVL